MCGFHAIQRLYLALISAFYTWRRGEGHNEVSAAQGLFQSTNRILIAQDYIRTYVAGYGTGLISDSVRKPIRPTAFPC